MPTLLIRREPFLGALQAMEMASYDSRIVDAGPTKEAADLLNGTIERSENALWACNEMWPFIELKFRPQPAAAIKRYLERKPELTRLLVESHKHLAEIFGSHVRLSLELQEDVDDAGRHELVTTVYTSFPPKLARQLMDIFDEAWYFENYDQLISELSFVLKFGA